MPIEDPNHLDGLEENPNGGPKLVLIDSTTWDDDAARWSGLLTKLRSYVGYLHGDEFRSKYPDVALREVCIEVVCTQPPSARMTQFTSFPPRGDESNRISVHYSTTS